MEEDVAWLAMSGYYGELCKQVISGPHIAEWWTIIATSGEYKFGYFTQVSLMSVCAKFQLPSMSRGCLKVCGSGVGGGFQLSLLSNINPSGIELLWIRVGPWQKLCVDNNCWVMKTNCYKGRIQY